MVKSAGEYTVDELARRAGCSVRNLRALQAAGLVPAPRLGGRTGYYGPDHERRLTAVLRLQDAGFSIAALRSLFAAWEQGLTLEEVLGLSPQARTAQSARMTEEPSVDPFAEFTGRRRPRRLLTVVPTSVLDAPEPGLAS